MYPIYFSLRQRLYSTVTKYTQSFLTYVKRLSKEERERQDRQAKFKHIEQLLSHRLLVSGGNLRGHGKTAGCLKTLLVEPDSYLIVRSKRRVDELTHRYPQLKGRILDGSRLDKLKGHDVFKAKEVMVDEVSPYTAKALMSYIPVVYGFIHLD